MAAISGCLAGRSKQYCSFLGALLETSMRLAVMLATCSALPPHFIFSPYFTAHFMNKKK